MIASIKLQNTFIFCFTEAQSALQQLSTKMALDCSTCHQLYGGSVISTD
jgi:hypothetical protein